MDSKKIFLVINTGYLGDVVLTSKLTRDIKKEYPSSKLIFIVDTPYESLAKGLPGVDEVFCYNRKKCQNIFGYFKFLRDFPYKNKIDYAFITTCQKNRLVLAKMLGVKKIFTLLEFYETSLYDELKRKNILNYKFALGAANMLSYLTGRATDNKDIEYIIPEDANEKITKRFEEMDIQNDLIAINPKAGDDWKCWSSEEVVKFAKLVMQNGKKVVLTGVLKDGTDCIEALNEQIGADNYLNFVGKTSIPEMAALYKRCQAVVSVDTGSMHMACAVGVPTIALFFRENFDYWGPFDLEKNSCLYSEDGIRAEIVYKELEKMLNLEQIAANC